LIRVLRDPAAHAARVVGEDPAHHAGVERRRIGTDARAVGEQRPVDAPADDARLDAHAPAVVERLDAPPVAGQIDEDPVGHGLAGKAGPGGAERHRDVLAAAEPENTADVVDRSRAHDDLRDQRVEARIRGVRGAVDRPIEDLVRFQELLERLPHGVRL
jgi:hypothetical protein